MKEKKNKKIIIDCQLFQGLSYHRGIGRYSMNLLKSFFANHFEEISKNYQIFLLFNSNLPLTEKLINDIDNFGINYTLLNLKLPISDHFSDYFAGEKIYTSVLSEKLNSHLGELSAEDIFFILSNYEYPAFSSFPTLPIHKWIIAYDVIPHLFPDKYLTTTKDNYYGKAKSYYIADRIFSISNTTKNDLIIYYNIAAEKVVNLDGGRIKNPIDIGSKAYQDATSRWKDKSFCIFNSGYDWRKNYRNTIAAFIDYLKNNNDPEVYLVVTSFFPLKEIYDVLRQYPKKYQNQVIFVGHVSDEELDVIYSYSKCLIFTPIYEGLGLPILEAVDYNKPVLCSSIPIFKEISATAFNWCSPDSIKSISAGIKQTLAISESDFNSRKDEYMRISEKYTWQRSARLLFSTLMNEKPISINLNKQKVAIFGPKLDSFSGISKYCAALISQLEEDFEVTYIYESGINAKPLRNHPYEYYLNNISIEQITFDKLKEFSYIFYNLGNNEFHVKTLNYALSVPGILIIHDLYLLDLINYAHHTGNISSQLHKHIIELSDQANDPTYTLSLVQSSYGVITHSQYAEEIINQGNINHTPIKAIHLPLTVNPEIDKFKTDNVFHIGIAGVLGSNKGIEEFLTKMDFSRINASIKLHIFGYNINDEYIRALRKNFGHIDFILDSSPSDLYFQEKLKNLDLLINLRLNYKGETSNTTLEAMRYKVPVVVYDIGWFSELPDGAVIKIKDVENMANDLQEYINQPTKLNIVAESGFNYIITNHFHYSPIFEKEFLNALNSHNNYQLFLKMKTINGEISPLIFFE